MNTVERCQPGKIRFYVDKYSIGQKKEEV